MLDYDYDSVNRDAGQFWVLKNKLFDSCYRKRKIAAKKRFVPFFWRKAFLFGSFYRASQLASLLSLQDDEEESEEDDSDEVRNSIPF